MKLVNDAVKIRLSIERCKDEKKKEKLMAALIRCTQAMNNGEWMEYQKRIAK